MCLFCARILFEAKHIYFVINWFAYYSFNTLWSGVYLVIAGLISSKHDHIL